jgi:predicted RNase H-like HicB family nuclease
VAALADDRRTPPLQVADTRQVLIHPGEDGYWVAECPSLPGCVSQGTTREEAVRNIKEAIEGYNLALEEAGLPVPEERFDALLLAV